MKRLCLAAFGFGLILALAGCGDPESPEQQIRRLVERGEVAVETGSLSELKALIADDYRDQAGRSRRALTQLVGIYLQRHSAIHLLIQIHSIEIEAPDNARLALYVAMAGRPLPDVGQLLSVRADLMRFDLVLRREEGEWLVVSGSWRRASRDDFLN